MISNPKSKQFSIVLASDVSVRSMLQFLEEAESVIDDTVFEMLARAERAGMDNHAVWGTMKGRYETPRSLGFASAVTERAFYEAAQRNPRIRLLPLHAALRFLVSVPAEDTPVLCAMEPISDAAGNDRTFIYMDRGGKPWLRAEQSGRGSQPSYVFTIDLDQPVLFQDISPEIPA